MENITKLINTLNTNLQNLMSEDHGVVIHDTFAKTTTVVNLLVTIVATIFGGWITIQLFKRQEKMRIREELRLDFYREYKLLYKNFSDSLYNLKTDVNYIKFYLKYSKMPYPIYYTVNSVRVVQSDDLINLKEKVEDTYNKLKRINKHINDNPMIMKKHKGKTYDLVSSDMFLLKCYLNDISECLNEFEKNTYKIHTREEVIKKYEERLKEVMDSVGKIDEIDEIDELESQTHEVHKDMELEFLNKYFS